MSVRIVHETKRVSKFRKEIEKMNREELDFLNHLIDQERQRRKKEVYSEWLDYLETYKKVTSH
ncbi:hypothetical protein GGQ84_001341 [Desulfitispora alkaliphila]|uniref:hypothetical protein n=1 Tax=Desulfitispora alkaliphila TaxID=622674 RepID=UPI003D20051E